MVPSEKAPCSRRCRSAGPESPSLPGRNEEKWFPSKKTSANQRAGSLTSWAPVPPRRNEEKWFRRKQNAAHPGKADLLASRATASAGRNEENWFPRKKSGSNPPEAWLSASRAGPISRGMRKSGSARNRLRNLCALLNSKSSGDPRGLGGFARDRKVEEPAK